MNNSTAQKKTLTNTFGLSLLLVIISILVYANTLKNGFVLDDASAITQNTIVAKGVSAIPEIFTTPYRKGYFVTNNDLYRPLTLTLFAIERQLFENNPLPYHLVSILLFAACVLLLFTLLKTIAGSNKIHAAFFCCMLFALHPIHTEVVANIKSCDELLCFLFALLGLSQWMKYAHTGKKGQLLTGGLYYLLSLLSKESSITLLAVIPLVFFFYVNENRKRSAWLTLAAFASAAIFLCLRLWVLTTNHANNAGDILFTDNALAGNNISTSSRMATAILVLGYYLKLLFIPYPLSCDYSFSAIPFASFGDIWVIVTVVVYLSLLALGLYLLFQRRKDLYAFGILFFLITISIFSNIPFLIGAEMGERFDFFPSVGFCLIAGLLTDKLHVANVPWSKNVKVLMALVPVSFIFAALTISRNGDWSDNYTLYSTDVKKYPTAVKLNFSMAVELEKKIGETNGSEQKQIVADVKKYLNAALDVYPEYGDAINNLGEIYFYEGNYRQAIQLFKKKIAQTPDFVNPYSNIAACYGSLGKYDSSIYFAQAAISIDPQFKSSYEILRQVYNVLGKADSAKKYQAIEQSAGN